MNTRLLAVLPLALGCRDLVFQHAPLLADTLRAAQPTPASLVTHAFDGAGDDPTYHQNHPESECGPADRNNPVWISVDVVQDAGAAGVDTPQLVVGAPVAYRLGADDPWVDVGVTGADGRLAVKVPGGAEIALVGLPTSPSDFCAPRAKPAPALDPGANWIRATDARFTVFQVCPVSLHVTDAAGHPVTGYTVGTSIPSGDRFLPGYAHPLGGRTDSDGVLTTLAPCGQAYFSVNADDAADTATIVGPVQVATSADHSAQRIDAKLDATAFVEVRGVIHAASGAPQANVLVTLSTDARPVRGSTETRTAGDGSYTLRLGVGAGVADPGHYYLRAVTATDKQLLDDRDLKPGESTDWSPTFEAGRWVKVRCVGLNNDVCDTAPRCAPHDGHSVPSSGDRAGFTQTWCEGDSDVVYVGTTAVLVPPGNDVALLDRASLSGGVRARVPDGCWLQASTPSWSTIGGMASDRHYGGCEAATDDGGRNCEIDHLDAAGWGIDIQCGNGVAGAASLGSVVVADSVVDLGDHGVRSTQPGTGR